MGDEQRRVRRFSAGRVVGSCIAGAALVASSPAHAESAIGGVAFELAVRVLAWVTAHANGILATAYDRAPVLVTVLAALLILPATALVVLLAQALRLKIAERAQRNAMRREHAKPPAPSVPSTPIAWLTARDGARLTLPQAADIVRVGRHEDNDIRLPEATVHRHHAVIHRTPSAGFIITDVSGTGGNGIVVNGKRCTETQLDSGDTIQLGDAVLTFESALPAYLAALRSTILSQPTRG